MLKDYLLLHTENGNLIVHMTMKYLSELLPENLFMRVHRSYLVNQSHITIIGKSQIQLNDIEVPIGEHYKEMLLQKKSSL
ncbi:MAG: LytTR family transcriptional regulator [Flavobacterium sp.]|nr:MAG: LytTR family transcriptional regulator [Flavobacterium sp.]